MESCVNEGVRSQPGVKCDINSEQNTYPNWIGFNLLELDCYLLCEILGSFATLTATPVFTSKSTVDVQCFADVETISDGHIVKERAVEAFFTYVALHKASKQDTTMKQLVVGCFEVF